MSIFKDLSERAAVLSRDAAAHWDSSSPEIQAEINDAVDALLLAKSKLIRAEWKAEALKRDGAA
jgi:hypothetical protein